LIGVSGVPWFGKFHFQKGVGPVMARIAGEVPGACRPSQ
jgi:hypothetical protein